MKIAAIICEYNPFHTGHAYHIARTREETGADAILCVMSGNFVQRGRPAMFDKFFRAEMALLNGADLVLELPFCYAGQSAAYFAQGAVRLLQDTDVVTHLSFGAETADLEKLQMIAHGLAHESEEFRQELKSQLKMGVKYPLARARALDMPALTGSNDILAIEYLLAIKRFDATFSPVVIKREGADYNQTDVPKEDTHISATGLRRLLRRGELDRALDFVPDNCHKQIEEKISCGQYTDFEVLSSYVLGKLRTMTAEEIADYPDVSEGIENRIKQAAICSTDMTQLFAHIQTKRYTKTRIARILCNIVVDLKKQEFKWFQDNGAAYLRVLGATGTGQRVLRTIKENSDLPILTKTAHSQQMSDYARDMFALETRAGDVFVLCMTAREYRIGGQDYYISPVMI